MMTPEEFNDRLISCERWSRMVGLCGYRPDDIEAMGIRHNALLAAYRALWERVNETGPTSAVNAAETNAWEQAREHCPCADCKAQGRVTCDECGVDDSARCGQ